VQSLIDEVTQLASDLGIEMSLRGNGVTREQLDGTIDQLAYRAFEDQCTTTNPKQPLVAELKGIIEDAYTGEVGRSTRLRAEAASAIAAEGSGARDADAAEAPAP